MADSEEYTTGPKDLISKENLTPALKADKGNEVTLISFEVNDFVKKGTNMCCYVTNVNIKYSLLGETHDVSYIVKMNPNRNIAGYDTVMHHAFKGEETFFNTLAPQMKSALSDADLPALNVPNCFYASKEPQNQIVVMEDLRERGFKSCGFDLEYDMKCSTMALEALARFHSSSVLAQKRHPEEPFYNLYESTEELRNTSESYMFLFKGIDCTYNLLKHVGGYDKALEWLQRFRSPGDEELKSLFLPEPSPFNVVCHGDTNKNNILFRYDDGGNPIDIMFVDLQGVGLGSLGKDLGFFMFVNLNTTFRKSNKEELLNVYYNAFKANIEAGGESMPFTLQEFKQECIARQTLGVIVYLMRVPFFGGVSMDPSEFFKPFNEDQQNSLNRAIKGTFDNMPQLFTDVFAVFDELNENGFFQ